MEKIEKLQFNSVEAIAGSMEKMGFTKEEFEIIWNNRNFQNKVNLIISDQNLDAELKKKQIRSLISRAEAK
ncbi:MAG: hypothetical protein ABIC36_02655 [bacterium]